MKKVLLATLTFACLSSVAQAQITKGTIFIGTDARYNAHKTPNAPVTRYKHYQFTPSVGYTFKDNQVAGISLGYGRIDKDGTHENGTTDYYSGGVFYRRYFHLVKGLYAYGHASADYTFTDSRQQYSTDYSATIRQNTISLGVYPGLSYRLHQRIHVDVAWRNLPTLYYSNSQVKTYALGGNTETRYSNFKFRNSTQPLSPISVGFRIGLGKK